MRPKTLKEAEERLKKSREHEAMMEQIRKKDIAIKSKVITAYYCCVAIAIIMITITIFRLHYKYL